MILSIFVREGRWRKVAGLGVAVGLAAFQLGTAGAHVTDASSGSCSPHGAPGSKSGTAFSNCAHSTFWNASKGWTIHEWNRDIACPAGSGCSNALCGGTAVLDGHTYQRCKELATCWGSSSFKHGIPTVSGLVCN